MQPIAEWLNAMGVGQYGQRFADNDIDASLLRDLTERDLEKIGVPLGHRKRILRAIAELQATASSSEATRADAPQRRQLTVMFCDLVSSTPLSTRLDPEELRDIIGAFHRCCVEQIAKSDGVVARYMGDGMLVYFGYPQAHEDDAERAVRAGLALVGAVARLGDGAGMALQVRVGIATGLAHTIRHATFNRLHSATITTVEKFSYRRHTRRLALSLGGKPGKLGNRLRAVFLGQFLDLGGDLIGRAHLASGAGASAASVWSCTSPRPF